MMMRISHVSLWVNDIDEALAFYLNKLGFVKKEDVMCQDFRWVTVHLPNQSDLEVALLQAKTPEAKALVGKQCNGSPIWSILTSNCQQTYKDLTSKGVTFLEKPNQQPWGMQAIFQDLYGNTICLVQLPTE
jgi:predicted enzyme related to lactoylglutathione lyase